MDTFVPSALIASLLTPKMNYYFSTTHSEKRKHALETLEECATNIQTIVVMHIQRKMRDAYDAEKEVILLVSAGRPRHGLVAAKMAPCVIVIL